MVGKEINFKSILNFHLKVIRWMTMFIRRKKKFYLVQNVDIFIIEYQYLIFIYHTYTHFHPSLHLSLLLKKFFFLYKRSTLYAFGFNILSSFSLSDFHFSYSLLPSFLANVNWWWWWWYKLTKLCKWFSRIIFISLP